MSPVEQLLANNRDWAAEMIATALIDRPVCPNATRVIMPKTNTPAAPMPKTCHAGEAANRPIRDRASRKNPTTNQK